MHNKLFTRLIHSALNYKTGFIFAFVILLMEGVRLSVTLPAHLEMSFGLDCFFTMSCC